MRKNKLELLMSLLILLAAWVLSREAAQTAVSADAVKNGAQTFVVVIDAGHGGEDPGKVSGSGTLEKDINLAIALRLERMLQAADVKTVMTRRADEGLDSRKNGSKKVEDLKNRCALIRKSKPDCVVSVHQNSYQDAAIRGAQTFYYADSAEGKRLAQLIQQQLISHVAPDNHREAKGNKSYYLLKKTDAPIVIAECGFLSNPEEEKLLKTAEYQEKTAWAIYMGVMAFLNAG